MIEALAAPLLAAASLGFVVLFGASTKHKLGQWLTFRFVLDDYRVLPSALVGFAAVLVVTVELVLLVGWVLVLVQALGLVVIAEALVRLVAVGTAVLLSVYALAMLSLLLRGRVHVDCGCSAADVPVSYRLVIRNAVLAAVPLAIALAPAPILDVSALLVGIAAAGIAILLYAAFNQLARNAAEQASFLVSSS